MTDPSSQPFACQRKPVTEWDTSEVAVWLICTFGHDGTALARFRSTTGSALVAMDASHLTGKEMGFSHAQAKLILERIAFTVQVSSVEDAAIEMDKLKAEKRTLEEELMTLKHLEELVDKIETLKLEKQVIQDEVDEHNRAEELAAEMMKIKLEKQAVEEELEALKEQKTENVVAIQSSAQLRQDEPHVGKRHYKEDAYQKNRYF